MKRGRKWIIDYDTKYGVSHAGRGGFLWKERKEVPTFGDCVPGIFVFQVIGVDQWISLTLFSFFVK